MKNNRSPLILAVEKNLRDIEAAKPWPTWKNVVATVFFGIVFGLIFAAALTS